MPKNIIRNKQQRQNMCQQQVPFEKVHRKVRLAAEDGQQHPLQTANITATLDNMQSEEL